MESNSFVGVWRVLQTGSLGGTHFDPLLLPRYCCIIYPTCTPRVRGAAQREQSPNENVVRRDCISPTSRLFKQPLTSARPSLFSCRSRSPLRNSVHSVDQRAQGNLLGKPCLHVVQNVGVETCSSRTRLHRDHHQHGR
jgi:hypothetical protein